MNKIAYIQVALTGEGFCTAAKDGFYLMIRNAGRFSALNGVGFLIIIFGKLFICIFTSFSCYLIITNASYYADNLYSPVVPTIFFFVIAYLIASFFLDIYEMAADAIL